MIKRIFEKEERFRIPSTFLTEENLEIEEVGIRYPWIKEDPGMMYTLKWKGMRIPGEYAYRNYSFIDPETGEEMTREKMEKLWNKQIRGFENPEFLRIEEIRPERMSVAELTGEYRQIMENEPFGWMMRKYKVWWKGKELEGIFYLDYGDLIDENLKKCGQEQIQELYDRLEGSQG